MANASKRTRNAELVAHWSKLFENFEASPQSCYEAVEAALARRQIPEIRISRVFWKETGLFSAEREYLRAERKRHVLDVCAAPFGTGFFFSSWLLIDRPRFTLAHFLGMLTGLAAILCCQTIWSELMRWYVRTYRVPPPLVLPYSTILGAVLIALAVLLLVMRAARLGQRSALEEFLLGLTIIGPIIDLFYRRVTYYEIDTALAFQAASHAAILEVIDQLTTAKGMRPMTEDERKPVLRDFFKR